MAWESGQPSRRDFQSASLGGRDFWLVPKGEGNDGFPPQVQAKPPELLTFGHPDIKHIAEYTYTGLPQDKKRIRLLKLYQGEALGSKIFCELMEVEYDQRFHIPAKIQEVSAQGGESESIRNSSTGLDEEDEGDRSDLETRCQKKKETKAEELERKKRQEVREVLKVVDELKKDPEEEKRKEEKNFEERFQHWKKAKKNEVQYEALSWCWGNEEEDYVVLIKRGGRTFRKRVRKELALALKYLRRGGRERILWVDAICIDQDNPDERNHQVQMMSRIYTRAQQVCIWLGEADTDSETAIKFIKDEMKELKNFDTISSNEQYSRKWQALMSLMQRDWFFRRWVVQEIALASTATVYCGPHSVPWKSFAVAVELFVEVETATHRLSEVMKRDEKFRHVPGWFEYVSELGASLLVQATGKVFRTKRTPMQPDPDSSDDEAMEGAKYNKGDDQGKKKKKEEEEEQRMRERIRETQTIDPLERRSLLSLEYLVSTMFIFQATEPRDVVYALLAIARDASPFAPALSGQEDQKLFLVMTLLDRFLAEKPFVVDYNRPYSDVSRDFVEFCIARTYKTDPHQALDILCRPWALESPRGRSIRLKRKESETRRLMPKRGHWKKCEKLIEENESGTWEENGRHFRYRYITNKTLSWTLDTRVNELYKKDIKTTEVWSSPCTRSGCSHAEESCTPLQWKPSDGWQEIEAKYFPSNGDSDQGGQDIGLPSWVARSSQAPFMLDHSPGMEMRKTSRANADPLVGSPLDGHRNYNAAGSEKLDLKTLKFKKRPVMEHYSLFVKGFKLDKVVEVMDASQLGSIPRPWLELGGWTDLTQDPPDEFWRTIVADRGRDNRNPPYYYARACKESVHKGGHLGGSVNTTALINDEQNSIVAEFCRRVHAVIWNRCLFKTEKNRLGLASKVKVGDIVGILYGCTVPVILRESKKKDAQFSEDRKLTAEADLMLEAEEDRVETLKACIRRARGNRERKAKYKPEKKKYKRAEWEEMMDARQAYLEEKGKEKDDAKTKAVEEATIAKAKEDRKVFRMKLANQIKDADEEKENARLADEKAKANRSAAAQSIEKAQAAAKAAQDAVDRNAAAAEDAITEQLKAAAKDALEHVAATRTAANTIKSAAQQAINEAKRADREADEKRDAALRAAKVAAVPAENLQGSNTAQATTGTSTTSEAQAKGTNGTKAPKEEPWKHYWYEFKGECYLHGMMDGEAMREKFYKGLEDWIFELR